jgi:cyclase
MLIIPAIDILGGKCVRLSRGDYAQKTIYSPGPLAMAKQFIRQGAKMLHVVDLDGAKIGFPISQKLILKIRAAVNVPLQVGGGIRDISAARQYLDAGIERIVIGTQAIINPALLTVLMREYGSSRVVVAVEIKRGRLAMQGWQKIQNENYFDFAKELKSLGVTEILFTDIERDGTLTKPNFQVIRELTEMGFNLVASGGVAGLEALERLKALGCFGTVLGKALYENKIALKDALRVARPVSNLTKRIIPCLDVKDGRVVKGISFMNLQDAGDPVVLGKKYSEEGADELVFLDIAASQENRQTLWDLVAKVAKEVFIPFTVGGGIKTIDDIRKLLQLGADKVSINTAAVLDPDLITQAAFAFGRQCVVVAIDAKKKNGKYKVFLKGGTRETPWEVVAWAKEAEQRGAGEILLTSMNQDGTKAGYDLELLKKVSEAVKIPVIASGGAGSLEDLKLALTQGKADAVLAASLFHYGQLSLSQVKKYLLNNDIPVRL